MAALDRYVSRVPRRYRRVGGRSHGRRGHVPSAATLCRRAPGAVRREGNAGGKLMTPPTTEAPPRAADRGDIATGDRLSSDELQKIDAYWRACTYLAAGMIYLRGNPLLREPLQAE